MTISSAIRPAVSFTPSRKLGKAVIGVAIAFGLIGVSLSLLFAGSQAILGASLVGGFSLIFILYGLMYLYNARNWYHFYNDHFVVSNRHENQRVPYTQVTSVDGGEFVSQRVNVNRTVIIHLKDGRQFRLFEQVQGKGRNDPTFQKIVAHVQARVKRT